MENYDFPGNIRELKNMVEKAMIMCEKHRLAIKDFNSGSGFDMFSPNPGSSHQVFDLEKLEYNAILKALKVSNYHKTKAASLLNITRQALNRKINKYGIRLPA